MASCTTLKARYDKLIAQIAKLETAYDEAILDYPIVQHSFGSSEGSTSSTTRNPKMIREEIDELQRQADQLATRCRAQGIPTMAFRRRL